MRTAIVIVGEAWGAEEEKAHAPFVGSSGRFLTSMLADAGISRSDCFLTNVFNLHPPRNDIEAFCGPKTTAIGDYPALKGSHFVRTEFIPEIERLGDEIALHDPNIIIALGNTAMWALLGKTAISKYRGVTELSTHTAVGFKVLPTYHPAAVLRQIELRPITVLDLAKANRESAYPDLRRPVRQIFIPETVGDLDEYDRQYLATAQRIAVDIETSGKQVTCIGFAPDRASALVVPFVDPRRKDRAYWTHAKDESGAWGFVKSVLLRPTPKTFQNGLYDASFLYRSCGLKVYGMTHDTMLLHHALQPESPKALGFLGSIYTNERAWKEIRGTTKTIKRDE